MITPPRFFESLLSAFGATPEYRELVLGDLAEELALRVTYDGEPAARAWYRREAIRSIPHLIANGFRAGRLRGVTRIAGIVVTAWLLTAMTLGIAFTILYSAVVLVFPERPSLTGTTPLSIANATTLLALAGFCGGWFAAWLDRQSPLVSASALGITWGMIEAVLLASGPIPIWFRIMIPLLLVVTAVAGGVRRVRSDALASPAAAACRSPQV